MKLKGQLPANCVIRDSTTLWRKLEKCGGLDVERYDLGFKVQLCRDLQFDAKRSIARQLRVKSVSVEDFLRAFFSAVQPFGQMLHDLLSMFERANASRSSTGTLLLQFDFGQNIPNLNFDLNSFRAWVQRFANISAVNAVVLPHWNHDLLEQLCSLLERPLAKCGAPAPAGVLSSEAERWLAEYETNRRWPTSGVPPPEIPPGRFAEALSHFWKILNQVIDASRHVGACRRALKAFHWDSTSLRSPYFTENYWLLKLLDDSGWVSRFVRAAYSVAPVPVCWDEIERGLGQLLERVPRILCPASQQVALLEEVLSLPVWKRRHDLYGAWVGAKIVEAIGEPMAVHSCDGTIKYSFGGAHLASSRADPTNPLHLWSELRSPLAKPRGKGRSRNIQPDYQLQVEPITYANSSRLVVECKQYLRASASSFADALSDYARGRPGAKIVLVNYGPAREGILDLVEEPFRSRCSVIGEFRPGNLDSNNRFREAVAAMRSPFLRQTNSPAPPPTLVDLPARPATLDNPADAGAISCKLSSELTVTLSWGAQPVDLDLHAWVHALTGEVSHIYYATPGSIDGPPHATLDTDRRHGNGTESIVVAKAERVRFAVHNYSRDTPLAASGANLTVSFEGFRAELACPASGAGVWWDALEFDLSSRTCRIEACLTDASPG